MFFMKRILLIIFALLLLIISSSCLEPEERSCHVGDFLSPYYCLWQSHWVIPIAFPDFQIIINSKISIEISKPVWLHYDKITGPTPTAVAFIDKYEGLKAEILNPRFLRQDIGDKIVLNAEISYYEKEILENIINKMDPNNYITISFNIVLGDVFLYSKDSYVYDNFNIVINTYANGNIISHIEHFTNIGEILSDHLKSAFYEIPNEAFGDNPDNKRRAIVNKIDAVKNMIIAKNPNGAYEKLRNDIMSKFDGQNGGNKSDDWIIDPFYSSNLFSIYLKILNVLDYLRS